VGHVLVVLVLGVLCVVGVLWLLLVILVHSSFILSVRCCIRLGSARL